jgi:hypothetical protein
MRHERWGVLIAAVGILVGGGLRSYGADASDTRGGHISLVVRTYTEPASAANLPKARRTASDTLATAGIQVVWLECALPSDATAPAACTQPLRWNELVIRIRSAGRVDGGPDVATLGFAFVDTEAGGGSLATVYADRVCMMAQDAGIDAAELLGRTMAHEVGHLLLGTNQHARAGLMRASWSAADLRRNRAAQWVFGVREGEVMRKAIAARQQRQTVESAVSLVARTGRWS